jgi:predicted FMN-binding regulatory protein PaiB
VIFHDVYTDIPGDEIDRFVAAQELGRLVTAAGGGVPHIGLYPFVYDGRTVEIHLVRSDEQIADLRVAPRCVFEVDEVLAVIPSYWVHPESAAVATAYHRTVIFECEATLSDDPALLVAQQRRLMARYQPEGGFRPLAPDDPLYQGALARLTAVELRITARRPKFKLGQNRPPSSRAKIVEELRKRGRRDDHRAADALAWTIAQEEQR